MCWLYQSAQLWHFPSFLLLPLMIVASIECFAGYLAWRFLLGLNGAVLGFVAGAMLCVLLGLSTLMLFGAVAGALVGAALLVIVVPLGSFVFAFGSAASLALLLGRTVWVPAQWLMPVAVSTGLVSAVAVLAGRRPVMITLAAVAGAQQTAGAWRAYFLPCDCPPVADTITASEWAGFITLTVAGLLVQLATSRRPRPSDLI